MTFALLDAAAGSPTGLGEGGGGLGFSGLPGVAVSFVTYHHTGEPSDNFVGITTGGSGRALTYVATTTKLPALRAGPHRVEVIVAGPAQLIVSVDGVRVLDAAVALPPRAYVGFTAATGGFYDLHSASAVTILY